MEKRISLESEAVAVCNAAAQPPLIFQLPPSQGRMVLERLQDETVFLYPAAIQTIMVKTKNWGNVKVFIVSPDNVTSPAHIIFYIHGGGWVFGSFHTHEKLVRELAARTGAVIVFPEYSRAPEARYPAAIEQCYDILCKLPLLTQKAGIRMDPDTLTVAGDSAGGNMAVAMSLLAKYRNGPGIQKQLLYYPVTDASFCTDSYIQFAEGYYLYRQGMIWFWEQYAPWVRERSQVTASPLCAGTGQLKGLPDTMILNGEADVLRDEGQDFGRKLREAGVNVTAMIFQGIIHDFVMLNALDQTEACRGAMNASVAWINEKNRRPGCNV